MTDTSFSFRLRDERKRLGFTQTDAAALAGMQRETWSRYESGALSPGTDVWVALAAAGADVQYILTGSRSDKAMSADESLLLERYRASPRDLRDAALRVLLGGDGPASRGHQVKQKVSGNAGQVVGIQQGVVNEQSNRPGGKRQR